MSDRIPSLDDVTRLDEVVERRYVALVRLGSAVAAAAGWEQLAAAVAGGLGDDAGEGPPVRLWTSGEQGPVEAARHPPDHPFPRQAPRDLRRAALLPEPVDGGGGSVLCGLVAAGAPGAVLEVCARDVDCELLRHAAPVIAARVALVDVQDPAGRVVGAASLAEGSDIAAVMGAFAAEARRLLEHDRLSAYLLTPDGGAVERFAVATSAIVPGEGVVVPLEEFGLRHILHTNRPLVSEDLATDPRIVGREDRARQNRRPAGALRPRARA